MSILPPEVRAGYVYDRVLRAIGDRPYDEDRLPDGIPAQGMVIFRPKASVKQVVSEGRGVTVTREPVTCTIHQGADQEDDPDASKGGLLIDEAGAVGGVWLVVGEWTAEYHMEDRYSNIPNEEIIVTEEHTEDNPLDIALASELIPTPTQKFVVNEQIYIDSKNYRDEAVKARNESQTFRNEAGQYRNGISEALESAEGFAADSAASASAAGDILESVQELDWRVDTSVGTRVYVGDTMIHGDTGWRDVSADILEGTPASWNAIRRLDNYVTVTLQLSGVEMGSVQKLYDLPTGFRPQVGSGFRQYQLDAEGYMWVMTPSQIRTQTSKSGNAWLTFTYPTSDSWPSTLPGSPA